MCVCGCMCLCALISIYFRFFISIISLCSHLYIHLSVFCTYLSLFITLFLCVYTFVFIARYKYCRTRYFRDIFRRHDQHSTPASYPRRNPIIFLPNSFTWHLELLIRKILLSMFKKISFQPKINQNNLALSYSVVSL